MEWDVIANVGENVYSEKGLAVVSKDFFNMFSFPFVEGNPNTLFRDKYTVAVSEQIAKKYFGDEDPVGKHFKINNKDVAVSEKKIKENSVRKILGATKTQFIKTTLTKSVLISVIATVFAIGVLYLILPLFNNLTQKNFSLDFTNPLYIFTLLLIPLLTGLASGIYPAIFSASFSLSNIKKSIANANSWQRKLLIVLQFTFSIGLIIATLISFKQVQFIRQKDLGFNKEHTIHFYLDENSSQYKTTKERLLKLEGIEMVAGKNDFSPTTMSMSQVLWPGINETEIFVQNHMDEDFFPMLKVNFIEGNNFATATDKQQGIIINKRAKELIGNNNPIEMKLTVWDKKFRVIGVIDNAHFWTLSEDIHPEFYVYSPNTQYFFVRFRNGFNIPVQKILGQIQTTIQEMHPSLPFDYKFMDDTYARLYDNDKRVGKIFSIMAMIAIFISCMGLFGLSTFNCL